MALCCISKTAERLLEPSAEGWQCFPGEEGGCGGMLSPPRSQRSRLARSVCPAPGKDSWTSTKTQDKGWEGLQLKEEAESSSAPAPRAPSWLPSVPTEPANPSRFAGGVCSGLCFPAAALGFGFTAPLGTKVFPEELPQPLCLTHPWRCP